MYCASICTLREIHVPLYKYDDNNNNNNNNNDNDNDDDDDDDDDDNNNNITYFKLLGSHTRHAIPAACV